MISKNCIKFIHSLDSKKNRKREGLFVAEGPKVVGDMMGHFGLHTLIATSSWLVTHYEKLNAACGRKDNGCPCVMTATEEELRKVSFLQHPQQVLAVFRLPEAYDLNEIRPESHLYLALDGVQDPGNLGTIIRIADWFGIEAVICSHESADAYNPKVVQATMGSLARTRVIYTDLNEWLDKHDNIPVYGTLLDGEDIYRQALSDHGIIIMGNEGNGISPSIRERVNRKLLIPDFHEGDTADSLNVAIATAITCSEFRRRR